MRPNGKKFKREVADRLEAGAIQAGANVQPRRTPCGQSLKIGNPNVWRHPWFTEPQWVPSLGEWVATVRPGFVNGRAPTVLQTVGYAQKTSKANQDFGINPLDGTPYFSSFIFDKPKEDEEIKPSEQIVPVPLYFNPAVALGFRNIGFDGSEAPPAFFAERGVNRPVPQPSVEDLLAGATLDLNPSPPPGNRLLRACDIVLHQPRTALSSTITTGPGIVDGISNVNQTLTTRSAPAGDRLKIFATGKIQDLSAAALDPTQNDYTEPTFDEIRVSTIFLLSPPNTPPYSAPDGSWLPFVAHNLFWNMSWAQPAFKPVLQDAIDAVTQLAFIGSILATGAAATTVNFEAASIRDAYQAAANLLQGQSLAGRFWTATGGGSDSQFPKSAPPPPAGMTGLDKAGRLQAGRVQVATAKKTAALDPVFPFTGKTFDLTLLTA